MFQESKTHVTRPRYCQALVRTFISIRKYVYISRYVPGYDSDCDHKELPMLELREQLSKIPFVPVEGGPSSSEPSSREYFPPKECFITSSDTKEHYRNIFPFVDFGQNGNSFLESCCAKKSPDASDIVRRIVQDPQRYLKALGKDM
jgi:hypothetical protein